MSTFSHILIEHQKVPNHHPTTGMETSLVALNALFGTSGAHTVPHICHQHHHHSQRLSYLVTKHRRTNIYTFAKNKLIISRETAENSSRLKNALSTSVNFFCQCTKHRVIPLCMCEMEPLRFVKPFNRYIR